MVKRGDDRRKRGRFEGEEECPIERTNARKRGGSIAITLRAESARTIGLEPTEISGDEDLKFIVSESEEHEGRLIFDLLDRSERAER